LLANQLLQNSECKANASELSRVAVVSTRDMKTTGHAIPHNTPPNRQAAVYMIAFTVKFAESKSRASMSNDEKHFLLFASVLVLCLSVKSARGVSIVP
jgi:hypothetical protein